MLQVKTIQAPTDWNRGVSLSHFATRLLPLDDPWTYVAATLAASNISIYISVYIFVSSRLHAAACR